MARTINTSNALGAKVLWSDALQDGNFSGRTDEKGSQAETSQGSAAIDTNSPGPGLGALNGVSQGVTSALASALSLPFTMACMWRMSGNNGVSNTLMSYVLDDSNYFTLAVENGASFDIRAQARAGGSAAYASGGSMGSYNTWYATAGIFESSTARRVWHAGNMGSDNTTSMSPSGAGKAIGIATTARGTPTSFLQGWVKYSVIFTGALTDGELDSWLADPEQIYTPAVTVGIVNFDRAKRGLLRGLTRGLK